jgi:hypothetical protein
MEKKLKLYVILDGNLIDVIAMDTAAVTNCE